MALFKIAHLFRRLRPLEMVLAQQVFHKSLPPINTIGITDGLGKDGSIWTLDRWSFDVLQRGPPDTLKDLAYLLNFGEAVRWDLSDSKSLNSAGPGYSERARDVLVHELTHVWQFKRGVNVKSSSLVAQQFGDGYDFPKGKEEPWISYNVEQQANIVEFWNRDRQDTNGEDHKLFPYIHFIIREEGDYKPKPLDIGDGRKMNELWGLDLPQLNVLLQMEKSPISDISSAPVTATSGDDSFLVILSGDVMFEFNESDLRPGTDQILERAARTIQSKIGPRFKDVVVNGHTDSVGKDGYNQQLSENRAKAVASWFFTRGYLSPAKTITQGFAATRPAAPNTTAGGRAKNRRVEIFLENN
jgi:outer membrane protein OmpA-like peptidoglycan-associated protein